MTSLSYLHRFLPPKDVFVLLGVGAIDDAMMFLTFVCKEPHRLNLASTT
jgi:hypothetical protein